MRQRAWLQHRYCILMDCQCPILDEQGWANAQQSGKRGQKAHEGNGNSF